MSGRLGLAIKLREFCAMTEAEVLAAFPTLDASYLAEIRTGGFYLDIEDAEGTMFRIWADAGDELFSVTDNFR